MVSATPPSGLGYVWVSELALVGDVLAVGLPDHQGGSAGQTTGVVRVYDRSAGTFSLLQSLVPPYSTSDTYFGREIALGADHVAVTDGRGDALVHEWNGAGYARQTTLSTNQVSMDAGGTRLVTSEAGNVVVYDLVGGTWSETTTLAHTSGSMGAKAVSGDIVFGATGSAPGEAVAFALDACGF
jgi:hypothetical protein